MKIVREIREIESNTVTISVPDTFIHRRAEITVLPLEELETRRAVKKKGWPPGFIRKVAGSIPDFPDIDSEGDYEKRELFP